MDRSVLSETLCDLYNEETSAALSSVPDDAHLTDDLGLDSVDTFSLIMQVERHFRIRFSNQEFRGIERVGQLLDLVSLKLQQQSSWRAA
jgi:acyl carrier protein